MDVEGPYSLEERRQMRRLIVASGVDVRTWVQRTRRSAEFVRSLSAEQADIITLQALAVAAEPEDLGSEDELEQAQTHFDAYAPDDRQKRLWQLLIEFRRRHHPDDQPNGA
jgi:hypothetical protein